MNKHSPLAGVPASTPAPVGAPATYSYRTTDCGTCSGDGLEGFRWSDGFPDTRRCSDCIRGKVDAACTDCNTVTALNDGGQCECCADASELPVVEFHMKWLCAGVLRNPNNRVEY